MSDDLKGRWALVTGTSSGIGVDIARQLADRGAGIVLTARREERLREVAGELGDDYGVGTEVIPKDLSRREAAGELKDAIHERGRQVDILVNNAGFGLYGKLVDQDPGGLEAMLDVDVVAPTQLTRLFAAEMVDRGWGRILQVASIGSYQPSPRYAAYSAAKAYLLSVSEALDYELSGTGVSCTTLCPGVTKTEFFDDSGQETLTWYQRLMMMESAKVARIGVRAMLKQKRSVVPGWINKVSIWMQRFMPRAMVVWVADQTMQEPE